jgi:hypothetical protein
MFIHPLEGEYYHERHRETVARAEREYAIRAALRGRPATPTRRRLLSRLGRRLVQWGERLQALERGPAAPAGCEPAA